MSPDPSSPIPRYAVSEIDGMLLPKPQPSGSWCRWADVEARLAQLAQEQATLRRDMCILACAYCDNIIEFESPEARWTAEGRAKAIDHLLACPNRPELALIEKLETAEAALGETRQALQQLQKEHDELLARVGPSVPGAAPTGSTAEQQTGVVTDAKRTDACWMCPKCHALSVSGYDPCAACGYDSRTGSGSISDRPRRVLARFLSECALACGRLPCSRKAVGL